MVRAVSSKTLSIELQASMPHSFLKSFTAWLQYKFSGAAADAERQQPPQSRSCASPPVNSSIFRAVSACGEGFAINEAI
jgi:hypothetical protein